MEQLQVLMQGNPAGTPNLAQQYQNAIETEPCYAPFKTKKFNIF